MAPELLPVEHDPYVSNQGVPDQGFENPNIPHLTVTPLGPDQGTPQGDLGGAVGGGAPAVNLIPAEPPPPLDLAQWMSQAAPQNPYAGTGLEQFKAATGQPPVTAAPPTGIELARQGYGLPEYVAQNLAGGMGEMATTPQRAYQHGLTPEEEIAFGTNVAANTMGARVPFAEPGAAGIFGGRLAATANREVMRQAEEMFARGSSEDEVFRATGISRGATDPGLRFEINDQDAKVTAEGKYSPYGGPNYPGQWKPGTTLGDIYDHPELYKAYPQLRDVPIDDVPRDIGGYPMFRGAIDPETGHIWIDGNMSEAGLKRTITHEMQHWIQGTEGWGTGASRYHNVLKPHVKVVQDRIVGKAQEGINRITDQLTRFLDERRAAGDTSDASGLINQFWNENPDTIKELGHLHRIVTGDQKWPEHLAYLTYRHVGGEVEARNAAEARLGYGPMQRRLFSPRQTEEYPPHQQIHVTREQALGTEDQGMHLLPMEHDPFKTDPYAVEGGRISTRIPTGKEAVENVMAQPRLTVGVHAMPEKTLQTAAEKIMGYPMLSPKEMQGTPAEIAQRMTRAVADNLLWLYDHPDIAAWRDRAMRWYEGGNRIAGEMADRYGMHKNAAAGVLAVLSPKTDWFQNVSMAYRVAHIDRALGDEMYSPEMMTSGRAFYGKSAVGRARLNNIEGKRYSELTDPMDRAAWIRLYERNHIDPSFDVITPEGYASGAMKTGKGKESGIGTQSDENVAKALEIMDANGDPEKITHIIGPRHKVRNFYNNLIDPWSKEGDVTIDTHAIAAAHLRPYGMNDDPVTDNFGPAPSAAATGSMGLYPIYADAYRLAAAERRILPRQMQSVTWEAVRGLFPKAAKKAQFKNEAEATWRQAQQGVISKDTAREKIYELSGGKIRAPDWHTEGRP